MKKNYITIFTFISFVLLFFACSKGGEKDNKKMDIVDVFTIESIKADVKWDDVLYPATVTGVRVKSKVNGTLNEISYKEGEYIEKGACMFIVDKQANRAAYDRASIVLDKAKQENEKIKIKFNKAKAQYEKKSMKKKEYDIIAAEYKKTASDYKDAQAAMKDTEVQLRNTRVIAPVSGIAGVSIYKAGTEISPVEGTDTLTYISDLNPLKVTMQLPEEVASNFLSGFLHGRAKENVFINRQRIPVEAFLDDGSVYAERGGIVMFNTKTGGKKSGFVTVEAEFPNPNKKKVMIPGQVISIKILNAAYKDAIVILKSCIFRSVDGVFVFVVQEDNTVKAMPVNYEALGDFAFITAGLRGGEVVVSFASGSIEAGKKVNARKRDFILPDNYTTEIVPVPVQEIKKEKKKTAPAQAVKKGTQTQKKGAVKPKPTVNKKKAVSKNKVPANKKVVKK